MQVADQRAVAGAPFTLTWQLVGADGEPVDPGTVLVTVRGSDGTVVVTGQATTGTGSGPRQYVLTAAQTRQIDVLSVDWTVGGDVYASHLVDVVGRLWFTNAELRAAETAMAAAVNFTPAAISTAREQVEAKIEQWCGQAFVPRFAVETFAATSGPLLASVPTVRRVRWAEFLADDGTVLSTLTPAECAAVPGSDDTTITRSGGWSTGARVRVGYEHGQNVPPPGLKAAAMRLCREVLAKGKGGGLPENAISYSSSELGWSAVLVTPGVRGAHTTIPEVNEQIDANTFSVPGVA